MRFRDLITQAFIHMRQRKKRSLLSMVEIMFGIASVMLILSVGESARRYIFQQISLFGSDLILVMNGYIDKEERSTPTPFLKETLTYQDYRKLKSQIWIREITAGILSDDVILADGQDMAVKVIGTTSDELTMYDLQIEQGDFFSEEQVGAHARVIVLGKSIVNKLFHDRGAVGKSVRFSEQTFRVIGTMKESGTRFFQNLDESLYIPVTAAQDVYHREYVNGIALKPTVSLIEAKRRVEDMLRERHKIESGEQADFHVHTQEDVVRTSDQITKVLQWLLAAVAGISLVVGGIGIMNMTYVSVAERTAEIGLRKAVGAQTKDILLQFLVESTVVTTFGGIAGIVLGTIMSWIAIRMILIFQTGWTFHLSPIGIFSGLLVSCAIGVIFGVAPARRAAQLPAIHALRHE